MPNRDKIITINYTARLAETKDRIIAQAASRDQEKKKEMPVAVEMTMITMMMHAMTTMQMPEASKMMIREAEKDATTDVPVPLVVTMLTMMK